MPSTRRGGQNADVCGVRVGKLVQGSTFKDRMKFEDFALNVELPCALYFGVRRKKV